MRTTLAALVVSAAALLAVPLPSAHSVPAGGADHASTHRTSAARVVTVRQRVIDITNNKRRAHGCRNLNGNAALGRAAQRHSVRMADYFGSHAWDSALAHRLPGEAYFTDRFVAAGYRNWTRAAENVAYGYTTPSQVVNGWMHSTIHRRNILDCRFKDIGVGFARAADGTPYWTQDFGRR
ncbi:CAP domain-containing protein [Nocardioides sp. MH1]|uniref:CAP domain-containing protein n=1 Tax=Nocardioides sp. MH1 TaxID=3242490 RepID=UPI00351F955F